MQLLEKHSRLFPVTNVYVVSGQADILNFNEEKIGACEIEVEINELKSFVLRYKLNFSLSIEGKKISNSMSNYVSETDDGICMISQMFYSEEKDRMELCSLFYPADLSYIRLQKDNMVHYLNNGGNFTYE